MRAENFACFVSLILFRTCHGINEIHSAYACHHISNSLKGVHFPTMADISVSDKVNIVKLVFKTDECVAVAFQCFCTERE